MEFIQQLSQRKRESGALMAMRILCFLSQFYTSRTPDFEVLYGQVKRWEFGSAIKPAGGAASAKE